MKKFLESFWKTSINRSLNKLDETEEIKNSTEERKIEKETIDVTSNNIAKRIINQVKQELEA
jgi:hypothetical protein